MDKINWYPGSYITYQNETFQCFKSLASFTLLGKHSLVSFTAKAVVMFPQSVHCGF